MLQVLFVCCAGMSTSLLVEKVKKAAAERGVEMELDAVGEAEARKNLKGIDVVLLGPQVRYLESSFRKEVDGTDTKLDMANMLAYGRLDGNAILDQILELHANN